MRLFALAVFVSSLLACTGASPLPPKAATLNRLGVEALNAGDLQTAEARFAVALEYHPRFVEALVNLGLTELSRGNYEHARALFLKAQRINADLPHPHHGLGVLADKERRPADAVGFYRDALAVDPGFVPSRENLARDYFAAGMLDDAREQFLRLTEVAPTEDRGSSGLTETLLRMGLVEEADAVLGAALARQGKRPALLLLAARRALAEGHTGEARDALTMLADLHDAIATSAKAWLAVADLAAGDVDAAKKDAERALAEDRQETIATYALTAALEAERDPSALAWRARLSALTSGKY